MFLHAAARTPSLACPHAGGRVLEPSSGEIRLAGRWKHWFFGCLEDDFNVAARHHLHKVAKYNAGFEFGTSKDAALNGIVAEVDKRGVIGKQTRFVPIDGAGSGRAIILTNVIHAAACQLRGGDGQYVGFTCSIIE